MALVLRFLGGGMSAPCFFTNFPTAFSAESTSSFTVWAKPFEAFRLVVRFRDTGLEGGMGMLTSFVMMFSTFGFAGFRFFVIFVYKICCRLKIV